MGNRISITMSDEVLHKILLDESSEGASDIHMKAGHSLRVRIKGVIQRKEEYYFDKEAIVEATNILLNEKQRAHFRKRLNIDTSYQIIDGQGRIHRYRVNCAEDMNGPYVAIRIIPDTIREIEKIGFPNDVYKDIINLRAGLVLVTGITGSGKTTTLASLIQEIIRTRTVHIITIEDPVEYIYDSEDSIITQREIGVNLDSYVDGVNYALRQDPDVILIGEIRDPETAFRALEAAATGHLVLSTLHVINAVQAASRYVSIFDADEHPNIRNSLAANLSYVLSQQLIPPSCPGGERTLAMEVLNVKGSRAIQNHIREGNFKYIMSDMETGRSKKMVLMNDHLAWLVKQGKLTEETAALYRQ